MSATSSTIEEPPGTRTRLVTSAAALFSRNGYLGTGVKAVLAAAEAPYGSLYHFFPGGKQELGIAALEHSGAHGRARLEREYPPGADLVEATRAAFEGAAEQIAESDFSYACPIATVALEVSGADEPMRAAAGAAFESWIAFLEERYLAAGIKAARAHELALELFCLMEGAFLLSLSTRSLEPMHIAGKAAASAVAAALEASGSAGGMKRNPNGRKSGSIPRVSVGRAVKPKSASK